MNDDLIQLALDDLYGLLEGPDAEAARQRLATPEGQAAQAEARRVAALLADAVKVPFPEVRFHPPAARPAPRPASRYHWVGWVVAASALFAVGIPWVANAISDRTLAQQATLAKAEADDAQRQLDASLKAWQARVKQALDERDRSAAELAQQTRNLIVATEKAGDELRAKQLNVLVSGPAAMTPGAPNFYNIATQDFAGRPVPAQLSTRVVDQAGQVVYEPPAVATGGSFQLMLPADLPLTPDRELALEVTATGPAGPVARIKQELPLASPLYLAHLTTDKPLYQPGETVRMRALVLERGKLRPPTDDLSLTLTVLDPQGAELTTLSGAARLGADDKLRGLAAGEFALSESAPGGEYTVHLREASGRTSEQVRKFLVNRYQPASIEKKLEFTRKSYGPGEEVVAVCRAARVSGPLAQQPVKATAQVDGRDLPVTHAKTTDSQGGLVVKFTLPAEIDTGVASVSVTFSDGGATETLSKPVPVALKRLSVQFYPEGGDLIAGVPNRVYLQARTTLGKPAEISGRIVDAAGTTITTVETLRDDVEPGINQGQARFAFTPAAGATYRLAIDKPEGIIGDYPLPAAKASGVTLDAGVGVTTDRDSLPLVLHVAGGRRQLVIGAVARGRLLDHQRVDGKPGEPIAVQLRPAEGFGGITRVTVFEEIGAGRSRKLLPLAERLVYRAPSKRLDLSVAPDKVAYVPGEGVSLKIAAKDESGQPAAAIALVGVVNQSVVVMADEKNYRTMPTHFLLTGEVEKAEDLEHVDVLLGQHPKAAAALDLLLGVQGWRRFVESGQQRPPEGTARGPVVAPMITVDSMSYVQQRVSKAGQPAVASAQERFAAAESNLAQVVSMPAMLAEQKTRVITLLEQARAVLADRERAQRDRQAMLRTVVPWVTIMAAVLGVALGILATAHRSTLRLPAAACLALALVGGYYWLRGIEEPAVALEKRTDEQPTGGEVVRELILKDQDRYWLAQPKLAENAVDARDKAFMVLNLGQPKNEQEKLMHMAKPGDGGPAPVMPPVTGSATPPDNDGDPRAGAVRYFGGAPGAPGGPAPVPAPTERGPGGPTQPRSASRGGVGGAPAGGSKKVAQRPEFGVRIQNRDAIPMRGGLAGRGMALDDAIRESKDVAASGFVLREYAHVHPRSADGARADFAETVYWHPALIVPGDGATVRFDLSDAVTRYQGLVAAHSLDGRLGAAQTLLVARKPLSLDFPLPVEVTANDRIDLPVSISNETDQARPVQLGFEFRGLAPVGPQPTLTWSQPSSSRGRRLVGLRPIETEGSATIRLALAGDDAIQRRLTIVPEGFPVQGQVSQELRSTAKHLVSLPSTWVPGSLKCEVAVFPTPLADLQRGLEGLLREPGGCFEQTSTTNYPNTLILNYLQETNQAQPELMARARGMLDRGYARLTSFEVPAASAKAGYEWFGHAPAHEALTAYGLLQFRDMARVAEVDAKMLERTRTYLMSRRDGQGGFLRSKAALDSFGRASDSVTNAYIVWALTESGPTDDVTTELKKLESESLTSSDPYFLALVANALLNRDRVEPARAILTRLAGQQQANGSLTGGSKSITGSQGNTLTVETTALGLLGWLKANQTGEYAAAIRKGVTWIGKQRQGSGTFGPTQSTILALKALIAYAKAYKQPPEGGTISVNIGEQVVATIDYTADRQDAIVLDLPDPSRWLKPGDNNLTVTTSGKNVYPYTLAWSYHTLQPPTAANSPITLSARLAKSDLVEGETTRLLVTVENVSKRGQGMTVAIVGLPAGVSLPDDFKQLRDLARVVDGTPGPIAFWELRGRELVLYWRDMAPDAKVELALDVIARIPGRYRGPASRAYLYYDPEAKHWVAPLTASIKPVE